MQVGIATSDAETPNAEKSDDKSDETGQRQRRCTMITEAKAKQIIDGAIRYARRKVDGIEVTLTGSNVATSRFANNGMTQNQFPTTESVAVRVLLKGRQARLNGDDLSEKGLKALVDNAIVAVKLLEKDEELQPLIKPKSSQGTRAVSRFDRKTAKMSAMDRALEVRKVIDVANAKKLICLGRLRLR